MRHAISLYGDRAERFDRVQEAIEDETGTELSQAQIVAILMDRAEERDPTITV